jgi:hypothetical protein
MVDDRRPATDATELMPDAPELMPAAEPVQAATEPMPAAAVPAADATEAMPRSEPAAPAATKEMPAVENGYDAEPARWAASAAVPTPDVRPIGGSSDEFALGPVAGEDGERSWWTPVVLGLVGVVLFGILMGGLWLIFKASENGSPGGSTTSAPAAPSSSAPPSQPPSQPPSSAAPSSRPPTTAAAGAVVPPVLGMSEEEARQRLTDTGLRVEVARRADPASPPGTVIDVDPDEGAAVAPNSVVRIVVAQAPKPSVSTPSVPAGG